MKKLLTLVLALFVVTTYSQVASTYTFSTPASTYSAIAGGTVLGDLNNDDEIFMGGAGCACTQTTSGLPIGFTFTYNGINYKRFGVSSNGYIKLGDNPSFTMNSSGYYNDMPSTGDNTIIGGYVNDLQGQTGSELQYLQTGSGSNKILTVQWSGYRHFGATSDLVNFQIILKQSDNSIELSYGTFTYGSGQSAWEATSMVGLYGTSNSDFYLRNSSWGGSGVGTWNGDNIADNAGSLPTNNLRYRFALTSSLPIELLSFVGYTADNINVLNWSTASETNNDYFTVEKSLNGLDWDKLFDVKGNGNSTTKINYIGYDRNPNQGVNYYRLKQTDFDGKSVTSKVISIDYTVSPKIIINVYNIMGQPVDVNYEGVKIIHYSDGTVLKTLVF